jgi:hypothetical protein
MSGAGTSSSIGSGDVGAGEGSVSGDDQVEQLVQSIRVEISAPSATTDIRSGRASIGTDTARASLRFASAQAIIETAEPSAEVTIE